MAEQDPNDLRSDNYSNMITKLGSGWDKSSYGYFGPSRVITPQELSLIYEGDSLAARVVDRLVDDATRVDWHLAGTDETYDWASVKSKLDDLQVIQRIADTWRWSRLYGGALTVMAVNDGHPYSAPLDLRTARDFTALSVVDSSMVIPQGYLPGLGSAAFGKPTAYEILVTWSESASASARSIHASRVIRFDGAKIPPNRLLYNNGWAPSILQRCWKDLNRLGSCLGYAENLLHEISVMVLGIEGLRDQLCGGDANASSIQTMLQSLKMGIDSLHLLALDKTDTYTEVKRSVDGVAALIEKFVEAMVRSTGIPRVILLGEQPGGLNADSKGEVRAWYDAVEAEQKLTLTPALNRVLEVEFAVRRNRGEQVPTEWTITYDSLMSEAPEAKAEGAVKWSGALASLVTIGVISPDEARQALVDNNVMDLQEPEPLAEGEIDPSVEGPEPEEEDSGPAPAPSLDAPDDLISIRDAALRLGVPTRTISLMVDKGQLRYWQVGGHRQVSLSDIVALASAHHAPQT